VGRGPERNREEGLSVARPQFQAGSLSGARVAQLNSFLLGGPAWPVEKLSARVEPLGAERAGIEAKLAEADQRPHLREPNEQIEALVQLLSEPRRIYEAIEEDSKKILNQACFAKLFLDCHDDRRPFIERQKFSETMSLFQGA
jgi:hypothetical protein